MPSIRMSAGKYRVTLSVNYGHYYGERGTSTFYVDVTVNSDGTATATRTPTSATKSATWGANGEGTNSLYVGITVVSVVKIA